MAMNSKKGMFFTLIAITIVAAIIAFFTPNYEYLPMMSTIPTTRVRVTKANDLMRDLKTTLVERELTSSSYLAIKQLLQCIDYRDEFLQDLQKDFKDVLVNGTFDNGSLTSKCGVDYMGDRILNTRLSVLENVSERELHLTTNLSVNNATLYQSNLTGYEKFGVELDLNIKMDAGLANWDSNTTITTTLKVNDFDDPYYLVNANFTNRISFTNISNWTTPLVFDFIDNINYSKEDQAPDFLSRFENKTIASECCGIESMINPYELNITIDEPWSYVDYCFYGHMCHGSMAGNKSLWNITGITSQNTTEKFYMFKLEMYHVSKYDLQVDDRVVCEGDCP